MSDTNSSDEIDRLVEEVHGLSAPRQRALLSFLALAKKYDLSQEEILESLSSDLSRTPLEARRNTKSFYWSKVKGLVGKLKFLKTHFGVFSHSPGMLPEVVDLAIRVEENEGRLGQFEEAWLQRPVLVNQPVSDVGAARLFPLFLKACIIIYATFFLMIWVVPDFEKMIEEFAIPMSPVFQFTIGLINLLVQFWFVPILLLLFFLRKFFSKAFLFFRRGNPFIWEQPFLSPSVERAKALSYLARIKGPVPKEMFAGLWRLQKSLGVHPEPGETIPFEFLLNETTARKSEVILKTKAAGVTKETEAWLFSKSANVLRTKKQARSELYLRLWIYAVNVMLGGIVLLMGLSVFSFLVQVIDSL